jgi:hypothetical protein
MIHPDSELRLISPEIGYGPVATAFIPKGTIIWCRDDLDLVFTPEQVYAMTPWYRATIEKLAFFTRNNEYIMCWDDGRSMNHACDPAGRGVDQYMEIARRDIQPGEQLDCDYAWLGITTAFACFCGSPLCRGTIRPEDALVHGPAWVAEGIELIKGIPGVPQPLWQFARPRVRSAEVQAAMRDHPELPYSHGNWPWSLVPEMLPPGSGRA